MVSTMFTGTPTRTRRTDTQKDCINSGLAVTKLYDFHVKSTGQKRTSPEPAAALELREMARMFKMGNTQISAAHVKKR